MKTKKQKIKQQIVAVLIIGFMFVMITGTLNVGNVFAATSWYVNLYQNFVAGGFGITVNNVVPFNDITVSVAANSLSNLDSLNVWDLRGTGAGWSVTGYSNNLSIASAGINNISNTQIFFTPGVVTALQGSATGVANGQAALTAMSVGNTAKLINAAAAYGMGNYRLSNTVINIVYNGRSDQLAGSYAAVMTINLN
jgi:hypothetical protein